MALAGRRLPCALNSILGVSVQVRVLGLETITVYWVWESGGAAGRRRLLGNLQQLSGV